MGLNIVKVINGLLYKHLKGIELIGRIEAEGKEKGKFYIFGCKEEDQQKFYKGILEFDKSTKTLGFKTVEEVETFWINGCDGMFLTINKGDYEVIE